jgi:2-polyprenyl-3-methyl-5-hydroxy-6-metoxy-1,4-benzoquinol methylase
MNNCIENISCLACGSDRLNHALDLGIQPLANNFIKEATNEPKFPLGVNVCPNCYHLQLTHTVSPKIIYENYLYVSGTSKTLKEYSNWFAGYVDETIERNTYNVLDIGCNDGTQLDSFKSLGYNTYGIDPAKNIYEFSKAKHDVICDFFGRHLTEKIKTKFDAIVAQNVFAHNPNPLEFFQTCYDLMSDHTLLFVQTSQADMVLNNEFDTIYHEHINFFNINSMKHLAKRANLNLVNVFKTPIHGNSYVFVLSKTKTNDYYIQNLINLESKLLNIETYKKWENTVIANIQILKNTIQHYKDNGYKLVGYGAAAKGNTLLNYGDIKLDFIIDDSPLKQNTFTPGLNIPVTDIEVLDKLANDEKVLFMPLAWNFFVEISSKIKAKRNNTNDVFLKYFPKVEINNV